MRILFVFIFFLVTGGIQQAHAQISEAQAREMLSQRGIPEDTLRARLIKKGIDPDNISPDQLANFQSTIMETVAEIEAEKKLKGAETPTTVTETPTTVPNEKPVVENSVPPVPPVVPNKTPIYGQEIFRNNELAAYKSSTDVVVPEDYILDIGDKIGVIGFGRSQFEHILVVSNDGFVQPGDRLPKILLKGIRWSEAKEILFQRYSQYYVISRNEFQASMIQPRNITVNVFGEAVKTGAFTLPGINTAFNVITAAGGPTDIGSVRRIKVIRGQKSIPLDVYEFMNDPGVARNYFLQNNDYIHIPVAQKIIEIQGAIVRPMKYELLDSENLVQLIEYAGGTLPQAYLSDVQVTRYLSDRKVITNVNLRDLIEHGGDYVLYNGDLVQIKSLEEAPENFISIDGAVTFPGKYEKVEGMRIADLIRQSVLKQNARLDFAYLLKHQSDGTYKFERINLASIINNSESPENLELNNGDMMEVMSLNTFAEEGSFVVEGAVKNPNRFHFNPQGELKLEEALLLAGGPLQEAAPEGYIVRHDPAEPKIVEYFPINIENAMRDPASAANVEIRTGDIIHIFDKGESRDNVFVTVFGAVRYPGAYEFGPGMTLGDLVNLAGGLQFSADPMRIDVARAELHSGQELKITEFISQVEKETDGSYAGPFPLKAYDHVYVRNIPEFELQQIVSLEGEVKYPGTYALVKDKERISDVIRRAGGLTGEAFPEGAKLYRFGDSTGLVVINLTEALNNQNAPSNIVLLKGDKIIVPKSKDLVTIEGHVNLDQTYSPEYLDGEKTISVAFRGEKNAKYYVDQFAGGVSRDGAAAEITVQYADGRVQKTRNFLFFNNYPTIKKGSRIEVGPKIEKLVAQKEEKKTDWSGVLRDTMAQATAVLTLLILVDQLNK